MAIGEDDLGNLSEPSFYGDVIQDAIKLAEIYPYLDYGCLLPFAIAPYANNNSRLIMVVCSVLFHLSPQVLSKFGGSGAISNRLASGEVRIAAYNACVAELLTLSGEEMIDSLQRTYAVIDKQTVTVLAKEITNSYQDAADKGLPNVLEDLIDQLLAHKDELLGIE